MIEAFPLQWPFGYKRTQWRQSARFDTSFGVARDAIIAEVKRFGGRDCIISTDIPLKRDGFPYANYNKPDDPGVAVYFTYNKEQVVFACDKWNKVEDNLQAVRKAIEAFRGLERWGVSELLKQAFQGLKALPEQASVKPWWEELEVPKNASEEEIKKAYRRLSMTCHPDKGGNIDEWHKISEAYQQGLNAVA